MHARDLQVDINFNFVFHSQNVFCVSTFASSSSSCRALIYGHLFTETSPERTCVFNVQHNSVSVCTAKHIYGIGGTAAGSNRRCYIVVTDITNLSHVHRERYATGPMCALRMELFCTGRCWPWTSLEEGDKALYRPRPKWWAAVFIQSKIVDEGQ